MTALREVFLAVIKSLSRGRAFVRALVAFWISPTTLKGTESPSMPNGTGTLGISLPRTSPGGFLDEAEELLLQAVQGDALRAFSLRLKAQFQEALLQNPACMLPSYNHRLPSRSEHGQYLTLDVGGSTLRIALVELGGRVARGGESRILRLESFKIGREIKNLEGMAFFDWMAGKMAATVARAPDPDPDDDNDNNGTSERPLLMGLAWSFPIEQTSLKGGRLQGMGKGFLASNGLLGQDLGHIIGAACRTRGLHVELAAIVNDSTAALLSEAYVNPMTRFSLILGTGVNIAAHLPVPAVGRDKFGHRPPGWFREASHVIVNTELGMFGKGILPLTRWDEALNAAHLRPDFQPLEHLVSGCYLGEMCRLALVEAIDTTGVFGGVVPPSLLLPYSLDTETISFIEADLSTSRESSLALFQSRHPSPSRVTTTDMAFLRTLASLVSRRSSAIVAASLFALWQLKNEAEAQCASATSHGELDLEGHVVAFNGSVIEQYPQFLENCQGFVDGLVSTAGGRAGTISLVGARESSLLGAAVALACLREEGRAN